MVRRVLSILLSYHYFILTIGFAINVHYCQGQVVSINVASVESCCCDAMEDMSDCCSNSKVQIQLDIEQYFSPSLEYQFKYQVTDHPPFEYLANYFLNTDHNDQYLISESPPPIKQATWLLNCSLTFYG